MKEVIKMIKEAKYVYIIGNGGSASTANHFANDLVKMAGIRAISLCANEAIVTAYANDNGYENIFIDQLKVFLTQDDFLIVISGSGTSKNIVKAIKWATDIVNIFQFPTMNEMNCNMQKAENRHLQLAHDIAMKVAKRL